MPNETIRQLLARKSVRAYEDKPIPEQDIAFILEAAKQAPTAGNQMLYTILHITDPALKQTLSVTCDHQPFIAKAPLVLVFCADFHRWYDTFVAAGCNPRKPAVGDLLLALSDANVAAQNAVVAAHSLGLGSCYIGDILEQYEQHTALLRLPQWVLPAAMLVFGYPTPQQLARPKPPRFKSQYIVMENTYHPLTPEEHRAMFEASAQAAGRKQDFEAAMQSFCQRKYMSDFSLEMSRSVSRYLAQWETL